MVIRSLLWKMAMVRQQRNWSGRGEVSSIWKSEGRISQAAGDAMAAEAPAVEGEMACAEEYVVQADDWLSKLAERFYGDPLGYPAIVTATNQMHTTEPSFAFVEDPNLIEVGWKLCIPAN